MLGKFLHCMKIPTVYQTICFELVVILVVMTEQTGIEESFNLKCILVQLAITWQTYVLESNHIGSLL